MDSAGIFTSGDVVTPVSSVISGVAVIALVVGVALLGLFATRRIVALESLAPNHDVAGNLMTVVGGAYGVLVAFVAITAWAQMTDARQAVHDEANAVVDAWIISQGMAPLTASVQPAMVDYARLVIDSDWDEMNAGRDPVRSRAQLRHTLDLVLQYEPTGNREQVTYAALLHNLQDVGDARRLRLLAAQSRLPAQLWVSLLAGSAITLVFSYFFRLRSWRSQVAMTVLLAVAIGVNLYLIGSLDGAFTGDVRVTPQIFEVALERMRQPVPMPLAAP